MVGRAESKLVKHTKAVSLKNHKLDLASSEYSATHRSSPNSRKPGYRYFAKKHGVARETIRRCVNGQRTREQQAKEECTNKARRRRANYTMDRGLLGSSTTANKQEDRWDGEPNRGLAWWPASWKELDLQVQSSSAHSPAIMLGLELLYSASQRT